MADDYRLFLHCSQFISAMASSVPEYYRHLAEKRRQNAASDDASSTQDKERSEESASDDPVPYRADAFRMMLPSAEWQDRSLYSLTGPTIDGIQHNITINVEEEPEAETLEDFAQQHIESLEPSLDACWVLMDNPVELLCEMLAHRVIFVWRPNEGLRLYQEQIYVLHEGTGYILTASFTRKTRKQIGAQVERMMLSFNPLTPAA